MVSKDDRLKTSEEEVGGLPVHCGSKTDTMQNSGEFQELFRNNNVDFIRRFITTDEIWVYYNTPETKQQSK